jgi:site-specific DNA recombinase
MNNITTTQPEVVERGVVPKPSSGAPTSSADSEGHAPKRAVIYLRVSTPSQVNTDYNPEGISLPAQRDACELKCVALNAEVAREFVEPGRSATTIDKRPVFQEMIAWLKAEKNIDFVVVYQFNRIFRNSIDAAITKGELNKLGIRIVSTGMDLGDSLEGDMVEMILHAVDEYRSRADGADIAYKMGTKAKNGGTLGRAPLGYINRRDLSEGRNIGIVEFDPERAEHIAEAFELYATGNYSIETLQDELTERGLRTRPGRFTAGPVSTSKLAELLQDPNYKGIVTYKGELIPGRHKPLISQELFERVQVIIASRSRDGQRQRRHSHYLKGTLWCGNCHAQDFESRMILNWAKGNGGRYLYFFCRRRQQHHCDARYADGDEIEEAITNYYATLHFPKELAAALLQNMYETLAEEERSASLAEKQLKAELTRLDKQEENLLELAANGGLVVAKVRKRLADIARKRALLDERLGEGPERLAVGARLIENAVKLLDNPQKLYRLMSPQQRRHMNQAFFEKLYVNDDQIIDAILRPPFDELTKARDQALTAIGQPLRHRNEVSNDMSDWAGTPVALGGIFFGDGSNKGVMVRTSQ